MHRVQRQRFSFFVLLGLLCGVIGAAGVSGAAAAAAPGTPPPGVQGQGSAPGTEAKVASAPKRLTPRYQRQAPVPSPELRARFEAAMARQRERKEVPAPQGPVAGPGDIPPTRPAPGALAPARGRARGAGAPSLLTASGALDLFQSLVVAPATMPASSVINEPSLGQSGKNVIVSGNWYLALSTDGGVTQSFTAPWDDMSDFCCDQEVLHDRGRDLFLWYRQGVPDASGENRFVVSASTDAGASWCEYSIGPGDLTPNWANGTRFDFPHLALSNDFLYIHTGVQPGGAALLRLPLDAMQSCSSFSFWWWGQTSYWAAPVQGATAVMYIGDHRAQPSSFRIYQQPEATNVISWTDVSIPAWSLEEGNVCPSQDGLNWCARSDSVVRGAWLGHNQVGFLWNAKQGGGFPFPYVEGAIFDAVTLAYLGRPLLWDTDSAWHYPNASPNARGDIGGVAYFSTPTSFPTPIVIIRDDFTVGPAPWDAFFLSPIGAAGTPGWGDYVRARAFQPSQLGWGISAYTMQPTGAGTFGAESRYYLVARDRDLQSLIDWWQK